MLKDTDTTLIIGRGAYDATSVGFKPMVFQKSKVIDSINTLPASIATAIERQTFIIPSKASDKEYLYLNRGAFGYFGPRGHLLFPWPYIMDSTSNNHLKLKLSSSQPGVGYLVHRSKVSLEKEDNPLPLQINEDEAIIQNIFTLPSDSIAAAIKECLKKTKTQREQQLIQGFFRGSGCSLVGKDDKSRTVFLTPGAPPQYPAFCPINGKNCDTIAFVASQNSADLIPWFVSASGAKDLQRNPKRRMISVLLSLILYLLLGLYLHLTHLSGEAAFPWKQALQGLTLFTACPLVWWLARDRIAVNRHGGIRISVADPEYYRAFLALNDF